MPLYREMFCYLLLLPLTLIEQGNFIRFENRITIALHSGTTIPLCKIVCVAIYAERGVTAVLMYHTYRKMYSQRQSNIILVSMKLLRKSAYLSTKVNNYFTECLTKSLYQHSPESENQNQA